MFGDISGMMQKLKEAKKKVEETKVRLNTILVEGSAKNGQIKVEMTASRVVRSIKIHDNLLSDKEALEDYLVLALNDGIEKASKINEDELAIAAKEGMPNIPGMDMFK